MRESTKIAPESIYNTGCPAQTTIIGIKPQCEGIEIRVLSAIEPQTSHQSINCRFKILSAGTSNIYKPIFQGIVDREFEDASEALVEMNRLREELKIKVRPIKFAFALGKYQVK